MSGIAGVITPDGGRAGPQSLACMMRSLSHRGPDGAGAWHDGRAGLGHLALWDTPEAPDAPQPLRSEDGRLCVTADARLDNREELCARLRQRGAALRSDSDAELILWAYAVWGEGCPEKLLGDFAFAVWDSDRRQLFCARDPVGIKPFYYHCVGKTFRWASEPTALFADGAVTREPNRALLCLYLLGQHHEREETLDRGVYRLPAAHALVLKDGARRVRADWPPDPERTERPRTEGDYADHFRELFRQSVRARLRSHGPVGALLSGGLDSSSVVCSAGGARLEAFALLFGGLPCDEREHIEEVVRASGVPINYFRYEDGRRDLDFGQTVPSPDVAWFPTMLMLAPAFRAARQKGVRVMLDGIGGDDCLAVSYDHLTDLARQRRVGKLAAQLRHDAADSGRTALSLFVNHCVRPLVPRPVRAAVRALRAPFRRAGPPPWLNADCLREERIRERLRDRPAPVRFPTRSQQTICDGLLFGWNTNVAIPAYHAFCSRFSLECRHPFLDRRVIEFLLAVPEEQRWNGPWRKYVLRRAMEGCLPDTIRLRKSKAEFSAVVDGEVWRRQAGKVRNLLRTSALASLGVVHADRLLAQFERGLADGPDRRTAALFQNVLWLELWCRSALGWRQTEEAACA